MLSRRPFQTRNRDSWRHTTSGTSPPPGHGPDRGVGPSRVTGRRSDTWGVLTGPRTEGNGVPPTHTPLPTITSPVRVRRDPLLHGRRPTGPLSSLESLGTDHERTSSRGYDREVGRQGTVGLRRPKGETGRVGRLKCPKTDPRPLPGIPSARSVFAPTQFHPYVPIVFTRLGPLRTRFVPSAAPSPRTFQCPTPRHTRRRVSTLPASNRPTGERQETSTSGDSTGD